MGFNPLKEKGMPLEKQIRNWTDLTEVTYDKRAVDPFTRCRVITTNGAEMEGVWFSHQMARHVKDPDVRRQLAQLRRLEQLQQKAIGGMTPGNETTLELTLGYEQVAVELTAWLAQHTRDPNARAAMDFGLLEDFDHLYRYANFLDMHGERRPEEVIGRLTEIMPGRPTVAEHRHPYDDVRLPFDARQTDLQTQLHCMTVVAAEQQTMNFYNNVANRHHDATLRGLYTEIATIEEQHVTHYESLLDPDVTWFKNLVMHEYNEAWLYWSFMQTETDEAITKVWERHLQMELTHLQTAAALMKTHEGKDPADFLPQSFPEPMAFESNIDYVRKVLRDQVDLTCDRERYTPMDELPRSHRYHVYNAAVNEGGTPSQEVIRAHIDRNGADYRYEQGDHPVERLRERMKVVK